MADEDLLVRARLQNELSAGLRTIQADLAKTTQTAEALAASSGKAGGGLSDLENNRKSASAGLQALDSDLQGVSTSLSGAFVGALTTGATALGVLTGGVAAFGLKAAAQFQTSKLAFDTLLGSVQQGNDLFNQLRQISVTTPFQLTDIAPATQLLLRYGVAANQVIPILKSLLDAASLSGDPKGNLQALTLATGQIITAGRVNGRNALELTRAGIPIYQTMAAQLGITTAAAKKLGDTGKISSDEYIQALLAYEGPLAKLQGGAEKLTQTFSGQLTNLWDAVKLKLADAAAPLTSMLTAQIKPITDIVSTALAQFGPATFKLVGTFTTGLMRILPVLAPLLTTIVSQFDRLVLSAGPAVALLQPVAGQIGNALVQLVNALVPEMPDLVRLFVAFVAVLPEMIRLLTNMIPLIDPMVKLVTAMLGFGPVRDIVAALLLGLLAYNRVSSIVGGLRDFASAIGLIGTKAEVAGVQAAISYGKLAALASIGVGVAGLAAGAGPVTKGKAGIGGDIAFIGSGALAGAGLGSVIPGVGTVVGGVAGGVAAAGYDVLGHLFGDPVVPGPTMNAHRVAAGSNGSLHITSGLRNYALRSPASGHARGTAVDVAGPGLVRYTQRVRSQGGWATIENHGGALHAHADFGDPAPGYARPSALASWMAGSPINLTVNVGQINGQVDMQRALEDAIERLEAQRRQRAYNPVAGRAVVAP